ncbi:MAG: cell envelope integrity protein TolA [Gammaproteobacteria bacterium]|jgi:colicin import membrane protein
MSFRHILYSLLLHLAVAVLLVISFDMAPVMIKPPPPSGNIVSAVTVDSKQVQAELDRLKQKDEQKQKRQQKLKKQAEAAERKRQSEEKRLAELKKKQQEQEKQNQQRLADLKKQQAEAEQKRKAEEEKQRQAEEERQKAEAAKQKAEAEQKRIEEQQRKAEAERKRKAAQKALQEQLAEEQRKRDAEQAKQDQKTIYLYGERIKQAIRQEFNTVGLPDGLSCVFVIRMIPGGQVVESHIEKSSGNPVFDRRAETALSKASPLPVPDNPRLFEKMRQIRLTFEPKS